MTTTEREEPRKTVWRLMWEKIEYEPAVVSNVLTAVVCYLGAEVLHLSSVTMALLYATVAALTGVGARAMSTPVVKLVKDGGDYGSEGRP